MKAIAIDQFGDIPHLEEISTPAPAPNEVLIKIEYTGVNPVDWKICQGMFKTRLPHEFPLIPGWDASGTITAIGKNVTNFKKGDEVYAYCRKPTIHFGTYAEYIAFEAVNVAPKPKNLSHAQAASIPLVALTAWQALFDEAKLKKDETVLIHAGAGGVGGMAIQFAKYAEAKILTTASSKNHDYVKKMGADVAIDYTKEDFVTAVRKLYPEGVDVVLDCVGSETLEKSYDILKPNGRLISIVNKPETTPNLYTAFVFVRPDGQQLRQIGSLIEEGIVVAPKIEELPLEDATKAQEKSKSGHTVGKIVLKI